MCEAELQVLTWHHIHLLVTHSSEFTVNVQLNPYFTLICFDWLSLHCCFALKHVSVPSKADLRADN